MTEAKHTPGPWEFGPYVHEDEDGNQAGRFLKNDDNEVVAYVDVQDEEDGWLIIAAPELLEALILARNYMSEWLRPGNVAYDRVNAAIAKATGAAVEA